MLAPARPAGRTVRLLAAVLLAVAAPLVVADPAAAAGCGRAGDPAPATPPWAQTRLAPDAVWPLTRGAGTTVAVIDSGVSATHPALRGKVLRGHDLGFAERFGRCDEAGHGTMVAGIIAGRQTEGSTFAGIAPDALILPVRVLRTTDRNFDQQLPVRIANAIRWAVDNGAGVINLSLETVPTSELAAAVNYAVAHRVVVVAAAGNQEQGTQRDQPAFPAGYRPVLAVAGVDQQDKHVDTSISGDYIDVAAPGLQIVAPAPGGGFFTEAEGGTSFAAAYVSGVAALVKSYYPDLPVQDVVNRIVATADNPPEGRTQEAGYGVVNPYRAVTAILGGRENVPAGTLPEPEDTDDSLAGARTAAAIAVVAALVLTALILMARPILRRGRERGWRAGPASRS
ncbi:type VII secretion-associated serine protease mycosin [Actinoplanes teichomyceticus]|uniref:Type VII secretion-associated serine protease mycosin n=1 Tax=Actinoplanes teichomyceticus TaxID=1867 RepID=A0A561WB84_ACTTI|nr:type VII secretion-associated serine protease mycosin [Actinoplanes teichomyceticus]GIF14945.1 hypothetical protein Ate01nite_49770 [Actinoplanes teichomyceticus]